MNESLAVAVGDGVRLFDVNGDRWGWPPEGKVGRVVKVGRKLVTIENEHGNPSVYRLEDGRSNDAYGNGWFLTAEQAEDKVRRSSAVEALREFGLELNHRVKLPTEQLEALLEALRSPR